MSALQAPTVGGETTSEEVLQLVSFTLGREEFAVEILRVQEINRMMEITRVPNSPDYVDGVVNLRGKVIPVVNLRKRLGMEPKANDSDVRIIVMEVRGKVIGFVVDSVSEVLRVPASIMDPPPAGAVGVEKGYIKAIGKLEDRLLSLLDLDEVMGS
jgi:purine-binding chemotaxis protein CheW